MSATSVNKAHHATSRTAVARPTSTVPRVDDQGLRLRSLEHGEAGAVLAVFSGMGRRSRELRFLATKPRLTDSDLRVLTAVDACHHVCLWCRSAAMKDPSQSGGSSVTSTGPTPPRWPSRSWTNGRAGASALFSCALSPCARSRSASDASRHASPARINQLIACWLRFRVASPSSVQTAGPSSTTCLSTRCHVSSRPRADLFRRVATSRPVPAANEPPHLVRVTTASSPR